MAWQTLLVTGDSHPRWVHGGLVCGNARVSAADLAGVIVVAPAHLSTGCLCRLAEYNVPVTLCDHLGRPRSVAYPMPLGKVVATRHRAQADLPLPIRKQVWKQLVRSKISGQAANVLDPIVAARLTAMAKQVRSGDPTNLEARAAALYWQAMFGREFRRWSHSSQTALLNYGYTVLRSHLLRSVLAAGLWPTLGVHHQHRSNAACLVDDLIEPLRPMVDAEVQRLNLESADSALRELTEFRLVRTGFGFHDVSAVCDAVVMQFARVVEGALATTMELPVWKVQ